MKKRIVIILIIILIFAATIAVGVYLFKSKNNSANPAITQGKTGSNFEIGKETVPKDATPGKSGTAVANKSTKQIFALVPKNIQGRLVSIVFKRKPFGENKRMASVLGFIYYDDSSKKATGVDYIFENGKFSKNPNPIPVPANPETVPASAIDFGYEGMQSILIKNTEYLNYRSKYPQLLGNCVATLNKNKQYGWEWITACSILENNKKTSVTFAVNLDTKQVSVIKKVNLK